MEPINIIDVVQLVPAQQSEVVLQDSITDRKKDRLQKLRNDFENMIQEHVKLSITKDRMAHRYGIIAQKQGVAPVNVAVSFEEKTIQAAWDVLQQDPARDVIFQKMEEYLFAQLGIEQEPTKQIIPELFKLLNREEYNEEILSVIVNEQLLKQAKYILTNIVIDPTLQIAFFGGGERQTALKQGFTKLTRGAELDLNIGIQPSIEDGSCISVVCGSTGGEMKRREDVAMILHPNNPRFAVVGNRTYILQSEVSLMPKLVEYLQTQRKLFTECFINNGATNNDITKLIADLQTVEIPENFSTLEPAEKTRIVNQYTKILTENMFSIEPAMQVKNCLDRNDDKEIKLFRVNGVQEIIDKTITYNPNINYIIYNTNNLAQNINSKGELVKISSDTTSNANAILFTKQQFPNLLPDMPIAIYTNNTEENRMLRTFGLMGVPVVAAFSDKSQDDIKSLSNTDNSTEKYGSLNPAFIITSENIKLWNLSANLLQAETDVEQKLPSIGIKAVAGNR